MAKDYQEKIKDILDKALKEHNEAYYDGYEASIQKITSPVEQIFYAQWYATQWLCDEFYLASQWRVECFGKVYFLDFSVFSPPYLKHTALTPVKLGIEIDGHDFHEKTKEQARNDKERQRNLERDNWRIVRFTGSEVYKSPDKCVDEVREIAWDLCDHNAYLIAGKNGGK